METYLREASFFHVAYLGWGCKLDPKLISVLVERWRPEMHTFHLPCGEYTITLEDVQLQLRLLVDGLVVTGLANSVGVHSVGNIVPGDESDEETRKNQNWWLPFTTTIMGSVPPSIFMSSSGLPVYIPTRNKFEWTPYKDLAIRAVILDEFLFGFWQSIPVAPQELDDLHRIDLRQLNTNWSVFHSQYIEMWNNLYDFLPTHDAILVPELACNPDYMSWFRIHDKPYLLTEEERHQRPHTSRPRRAPLNSRGGETGPSAAPTQEPASTASIALPSPQPLHYVPSYFGRYPNFVIFTQAQNIALHFSVSSSMSGWTIGHPSPMRYTPGPSHFLMMVMHTTMYRPSIHEAQIRSPLVGHLPNHLGIDRRCNDLHRLKANPDNHNLGWKLNLKRIQRVTIDHPDMA
ncbi:hypothetical protein Gogos_022250 [Gossypium gossypioides]|uniref:Aminotransferase-like plant mobile domain-containing protein n=1 Tax=Gossypium gossypioides TaxID=34282 RepID=A0A7J9D485_GOSGO|nr:hypothetical protein [Gossypium gossypioides]